MCKSRKGVGKFDMTEVGFAFTWLIKTSWFYPIFTLYLCILAVFLLASKHLQHQTSWIPEAEKGHLPWWHTLLGWRTPLANLILCMFLESGTALEMSLFWGYPPRTFESNSSWWTPVQRSFCSHQPSHWVARGGEAFPVAGLQEPKRFKQNQRKEVRSVTGLCPCTEAFSTKAEKVCVLTEKTHTCNVFGTGKVFQLLLIKCFCWWFIICAFSSCMTKPNGDMHMRNTQALSRLG